MEQNKLCLCGKCRQWFDFSEAVERERTVYNNVSITEKVCPYCNNLGYSAKEHEKFMRKFEKTNDVYY